MKHYLAIMGSMVLLLLTTIPAFSQDDSRQRERNEILKQLTDLRAVIDSLKALNNQDESIESLEERLEKRFTDLENKINNAVRGTSPIIFNPRTTAFINFAARGDNKTAFNEDGSVEISNRPFLRSTELDFRAPVDPYAEAVAILSVEDEAGQGFALDPEEVYGLIKRLPLLESAPMGMKLKVGKFRAPFGVSNRLHLHDLPWTTRPLVISKLLGTEHGDFFESGFNPIGADFDFFLPNPIPYTTLEMNIDIVKSGDLGMSGGVGGRQPAWLAHLTLSADLMNEHIVVLGASGYAERGRPSVSLLGLDATYKWAPSEQRSSRSAVVGGEIFWGRRTAIDSLQAEQVVRPRGWYGFAQVQLSYWLYLGIRYDWAQDPLESLPVTRSLAAYASYYTTEFLRFRIGYEHRTSDNDVVNGLNTAVLEINFVFGSHPTEPYWVNR